MNLILYQKISLSRVHTAGISTEASGTHMMISTFACLYNPPSVCVSMNPWRLTPHPGWSLAISTLFSNNLYTIVQAPATGWCYSRFNFTRTFNKDAGSVGHLVFHHKDAWGRDRPRKSLGRCGAPCAAPAGASASTPSLVGGQLFADAARRLSRTHSAAFNKWITLK